MQFTDRIKSHKPTQVQMKADAWLQMTTILQHTKMTTTYLHNCALLTLPGVSLVFDLVTLHNSRTSQQMVHVGVRLNLRRFVFGLVVSKSHFVVLRLSVVAAVLVDGAESLIAEC